MRSRRSVLGAIVLSGLLGFAAAFAVGAASKSAHNGSPAFTAAPVVPATHPAIHAAWVSAAVPGLTTVAAAPPPTSSTGAATPPPPTTTSAPTTASPAQAPHPTPGATGGGGGGGAGGGGGGGG
jgi:hypothetical protein